MLTRNRSASQGSSRSDGGKKDKRSNLSGYTIPKTGAGTFKEAAKKEQNKKRVASSPADVVKGKAQDSKKTP